MPATREAPWRWLVLLSALALVLAACEEEDAEQEPAERDDDAEVEEDPDADPDDDARATPGEDPNVDAGEEEDEVDDEPGQPVEGGTVLFGDDQEPSILNPFLSDGDTLATAKVARGTILPGAYRYNADVELEPYVIEEAETTEEPFTVTYSIREEAEWSDGEPITAEDFEFTLDTIMDEDAGWADEIVSRDGYELVTDVEIVDDQTITLQFEENWAAWQLMFTELLPRHELEGEPFETVWNEEITVAGGPFEFDEWTQGEQLRLVANENYWGEGPHLDEIVVRYATDTATLTQQLLRGEIDLSDPPPQIELIEQLDGATDRIDYEVEPGFSWEHLEYNTRQEGLDQAFVRQAINYAMDREILVEVLLAPMDPEAEVLHNAGMYFPNMSEYEPHWDTYEHDPDQARQLLEDNGCENEDGTYVCDGTELSFRLHTTQGNEQRELAQQFIQSDLAAVGIDIEIDNDERAALSERLLPPEDCDDSVCDWDIALFAWVGAPDPVGSANIHGCERPQNFTGACDEVATELLETADQTLDEEERVDLYNQADELLAEQAARLPLWRNPSILAYDQSIQGPQVNPTNHTNFWNSGEWAMVE